MTDITIQIRQTAESTSAAEIRGHQVLVDRPVAKGGSDRGPMGGELFLAGLGGCFMSNLLAAIKAREVKADNMVVEVTGTLESAPPHFSAVRLTIRGDYQDRDQMEKLVSMAEKGCIVSNTVRDSVKLQFMVI